MEKNRTCTCCGETKLESDFHINNKGYLYSHCKPCIRLKNNLRYKNNIEREKDRLNRNKRKIIQRWKRSKDAASRRRSSGISFELTLEQYTELVVDKKCSYCDGDLPKTMGGLDRIDSSKGYTVDNVVSCCAECNRIKGDSLTYDETKVVIKSLKEYRSEKARS